jgi:hypothetical protein
MSGDEIRTKEFLNGSDHIHHLAPSVDAKGWKATSVFIEDTQEFQPTIIRYLIELSVNRPYVIWVLGGVPPIPWTPIRSSQG